MFFTFFLFCFNYALQLNGYSRNSSNICSNTATVEVHPLVQAQRNAAALSHGELGEGIAGEARLGYANCLVASNHKKQLQRSL